MKNYYWSKYNKLIKLKNTNVLLYNSISGALWELDADAYGKLMEVKENIKNKTYKGDAAIHNHLADAHVISSLSDEDYLTLLKFQRLRRQASSKHISYTILPTLACNFNCRYCYESSRPNLFMSKEVEEDILKLVSSQKDAVFSIDWLGGEPLLGLDTIIRISESLIANETAFRSTLVTNGYLLDSETIKLLACSLHVSQIQVTVDGTKEMHNANRPHIENINSYDKIIENLDFIHQNLSSLNHLSVSIRMNIDKNNSDDFIEFYQYFRKKYPQFHVYPGIITASNGCLDRDHCLYNQQELANFLIKTKQAKGIQILPFFSNEGGNTCIADTLHSFVIGPEGELYKCWNDVGLKDKIVGQIKEGSIVRNNSILEAEYVSGTNPYEKENCKKCFLLPQCHGGCSNKKISGKDEAEYCHYLKYRFNDFTLAHYQDKIAEEQDNE